MRPKTPVLNFAKFPCQAPFFSHLLTRKYRLLCYPSVLRIISNQKVCRHVHQSVLKASNLVAFAAEFLFFPLTLLLVCKVPQNCFHIKRTSIQGGEFTTRICAADSFFAHATALTFADLVFEACSSRWYQAGSSSEKTLHLVVPLKCKFWVPNITTTRWAVESAPSPSRKVEISESKKIRKNLPSRKKQTIVSNATGRDDTSKLHSTSAQPRELQKWFGLKGFQLRKHGQCHRTGTLKFHMFQSLKDLSPPVAGKELCTCIKSFTFHVAIKPIKINRPQQTRIDWQHYQYWARRISHIQWKE